jgi:hypothetical protein
LDELGEFVGDETPIVGTVRHVAVEAFVYVGHDDDEGIVLGMTFDGGAAAPDGVIVGESVEEIEYGGRGCPGIGVFGQNNVHAEGEFEGLGIEAGFE